MRNRRTRGGEGRLRRLGAKHLFRGICKIVSEIRRERRAS